MKCKICNQEAGWFYPIFCFTGRCVTCDCYIEKKLYSIKISEWRKHRENSVKACDEWLNQLKKEYEE
jgi:ferredoxin